MNGDLRAAAREVDSVFGEKFERVKTRTRGTIVGIEKDELTGQVRNVSVSINGADGVLVPWTLNEPAIEGEDVNLARGKHMINPTYEVISKFTSTLVQTNKVLPGDSPTVVVDGIVNLPEASGPGGYRAKAMVRFQTFRRGGYDLWSQGWDRVVVRFRRADDESTWQQSAPIIPLPSALIVATLIGSILSGASSLTTQAGLNIPSNPDALAGGSVRLLVDNEIISGNYNATTGVVSSLTRGIEPISDDASTNANAHANGAPVILMSATVTIPDLPTGVDHLVQIAPARQDGTFGLFVPASSLSFTSWEQVDPPKSIDVATLKVTGVGRVGHDIRFARVLQDTNDNNMYDLRGYKIWRSANPGFDTITRYDSFSNAAAGYSDSLPVDAQPLIDDLSGDELIVPHNQTIWPAKRGVGDFFGVQAYRNAEGLVSPLIAWESDTEPPTGPSWNSWNVLSLERTIKVSYNELTDTANARDDRGHASFVVYRATDDDGTDETPIGLLDGDSFVYEPPFDQLYYYQLVSTDLSRNDSERLTGNRYWKRGVPSWLEDGLINGNFQIPGPVRTVTDVSTTNGGATITSTSAIFTESDVGALVVINGAGPGGAALVSAIVDYNSATSVNIGVSLPSATLSNATMKIGDLPKYWRVTLDSLNRLKAAEYLDNVGQSGSWGLKFTLAAGTYTIPNQANIALNLAIPRPYNPAKTQADLAFSIKADAGVTVTWVIRLWLAADDYSKGDVSFYSDSALKTGSHAGTGQWVLITDTTSDADLFDATPLYHVYAYEIQFAVEGGQVLASDKVFYVDDVSVDIS